MRLPQELLGIVVTPNVLDLAIADFADIHELHTNHLIALERNPAERAELLSRPYFLLDMIGVEPSLQGQGFARRMVEEKLRDLDSQRLPCYLETSRMSTARYYERFGFELAGQYRLATVDVFCLLREIGAGS